MRHVKQYKVHCTRHINEGGIEGRHANSEQKQKWTPQQGPTALGHLLKPATIAMKHQPGTLPIRQYITVLYCTSL